MTNKPYTLILNGCLVAYFKTQGEAMDRAREIQQQARKNTGRLPGFDIYHEPANGPVTRVHTEFAL